MTTHSPNFVFNKETLVLSVSLTQEDLAVFVDDPQKLIGGARLKMSGYIAENLISGFHLYQAEFLSAWEHLIKHPQLLPVTLPIAGGYTDDYRIELTRNIETSGYLLNLELRSGCSHDVFSRGIMAKIKQMCLQAGESANLNPAGVACAVFRATGRRNRLTQFPLSLAPLRSPEIFGKAYQIKVRRDTGHIELVLGKTAKGFIGREDEVIADVRSQIGTMINKPGSSGYFVVLEDRIRQAIREIGDGYYALGMGLPHVELAAIELGDDLVPCEFHYDLQYNQPNASLAVRAPEIPGTQFSRIKRWGPSLTPYFAEYLREAKSILTHLPANQRNHQSMIVAIDDSAALKIKQYIEDLLHETDTCSEDDADAVLVTGVQWLALTRTKLSAPHEEPETANTEVWKKTVLRELVGLDTFKNDPKWIQAKLIPQLSLAEIQAGMEALQKAGFIVADRMRGGRLMQSAKNILTGDRAKGEFLLQFHAEVLATSIQMLTQGDPDRQYYWTSFRTMPARQFAEIQESIRKKLEKIFAETGEALIPDQLYMLNLQSFLKS